MLDETNINGVPAYRAPMTTGGVYDATYWCGWTDGDDGYATIPQEKLMPWLVRCFQRRFSSVTPAFIGANPSTAAIASLLEANAQKSRTDEYGATTLVSHPFPRCGGPQAFMLMMAQRAPESLAHSIDKVTLHGAAQFDLHGNGWEVPEFFTGITWAAMAASGDGTHSTAGYLLMTFPELMAPGGIRGDGPAKGGLGRLFNTLVTVHGYKDGELDSVDDGEIAAAWMETAHALVPPLEFEVCFANAASRAREFTMRLRILEARSPHGNPTAADKMEGEPTMLSRVCQIGGCAPYLVRTVGSCSPATFVECLATLGAAMDPNYAGRPASLQMLRGVERWLKEHHATTLDELDVMRGQGKQIDRDASVQAVVKAATDGREFQRAAQATKASAASGSEERGDAYSRVMCSRLDGVAVLELPRVVESPEFGRLLQISRGFLDSGAEDGKTNCLRILLSAATRGHPDAQPIPLMQQVGWGKLSATAVPSLCPFEGIADELSLLLSRIVFSKTAPARPPTPLGIFAKQLREKDWGGMAEKSSSASVVDLHAALGVGRRNQTGYFLDVPLEQLYTKLAHVRDTKEVGVAVFAALGFKAEGPQSWGAFVDMLVKDVESHYCAGARESEIAVQLRLVVLGVLDLMAKRLNAVRYSSSVNPAPLAPHAFEPTSAPVVKWKQFMALLETQDQDYFLQFGPEILARGDKPYFETSPAPSAAAAAAAPRTSTRKRKSGDMADDLPLVTGQPAPDPLLGADGLRGPTAEAANAARNQKDVATLRELFPGYCAHHLYYHHVRGRAGCKRADCELDHERPDGLDAALEGLEGPGRA